MRHINKYNFYAQFCEWFLKKGETRFETMPSNDGGLYNFFLKSLNRTYVSEIITEQHPCCQYFQIDSCTRFSDL